MTRPANPNLCPLCGDEIPESLTDCPSCMETTYPSRAGRRETDLPGREIAGFRILREIGSGGMGTVFQAVDRKMKRKVALKVLARHLAASDKGGARFAREAWIGGKLNHPNLVQVFERGEWEDVLYFSMEYVDGGSLGDVIRNMKDFGRDPNWNLEFGTREYVNWAIDQVIAAARGLDHAHRQKVVHRDIKPMNILLNRDPCMVKIADFGLAVETDATRLTTEGKIFGTLAYIPPEQIQGETDRIDARTDIFSLAVTLFEMLTLELPFSGKTREMYLDAVLTREPKRPSRLNDRVGRDLEIVLTKALEKNPGDRYATAGAFADDLENVLNFRPIRARPPAWSARIGKWIRRRPIHAALAAVMIAGIPTVSILTIRGARQQRALETVEIGRLRQRGLELSNLRQYTEAIAAYSKVLAHRPDDVDSLVGRAILNTFIGRASPDGSRRQELADRAIADISRVVDLNPDVAWPYRVRAYIRDAFGDRDQAARDEGLAAELRSDEPDDRELALDGRLAFYAGRYREAVETFTELLNRRPNMAQTRVLRAQAYEALGNLTEARTDFEVASALAPDNIVPLVRLGRILTEAGELDAGVTYILRARNIQPDNPVVLENLSYNLNEQGIRAAVDGDVDTAREILRRSEETARRALELDPDLPNARLNLGVSLMERYRLQEEPDPDLVAAAIEAYDRVIRHWKEKGSDPTAAGYIDALVDQCDALIQSRALARAVEICGEIVTLQPDDPIGHYNLAGVYALLDRADDAFAELDRDVALGDTDYEYLQADEWFETLHGDRRWPLLLERMKQAAGSDPAPF